MAHKMKPHIPPKVKDPIKYDDPGGPHTPGAKKKRRERERKKKKNYRKVAANHNPGY